MFDFKIILIIYFRFDMFNFKTILIRNLGKTRLLKILRCLAFYLQLTVNAAVTILHCALFTLM